ncbi:hypothetical protein C8R48DRAFT_737149, partial [Suillus tomentosus]
MIQRYIIGKAIKSCQHRTRRSEPDHGHPVNKGNPEDLTGVIVVPAGSARESPIPSSM